MFGSDSQLQSHKVSLSSNVVWQMVQASQTDDPLGRFAKPCVSLMEICPLLDVPFSRKHLELHVFCFGGGSSNFFESDGQRVNQVIVSTPFGGLGTEVLRCRSSVAAQTQDYKKLVTLGPE